MNKEIKILLLVITISFLGLLFFGVYTLKDHDLGQNDNQDEAPPITAPTPTKPDQEERKDLPKVAIVIDDLGNSFSQDKKLASIEADLTLAILPFRENTQKSLEFFQNKQEVILHLPLEPISPEDKEENMIMADMSEQEISNKLELALADLNYKVSGINNHKGSLFTSDQKSMNSLLKQIKSENLFFVDSYTIASSRAYELAKQMNLKTAKRDVFLDGSNKEEEIKARLQEVVALAREKGSAIAIGHSRPATIEVLTEEVSKLKNKVEFVRVSEVLE